MYTKIEQNIRESHIGYKLASKDDISNGLTYNMAIHIEERRNSNWCIPILSKPVESSLNGLGFNNHYSEIMQDVL